MESILAGPRASLLRASCRQVTNRLCAESFSILLDILEGALALTNLVAILAKYELFVAVFNQIVVLRLVQTTVALLASNAVVLDQVAVVGALDSLC